MESNRKSFMDKVAALGPAAIFAALMIWATLETIRMLMGDSPASANLEPINPPEVTLPASAEVLAHARNAAGPLAMRPTSDPDRTLSAILIDTANFQDAGIISAQCQIVSGFTSVKAMLPTPTSVNWGAVRGEPSRIRVGINGDEVPLDLSPLSDSTAQALTAFWSLPMPIAFSYVELRDRKWHLPAVAPDSMDAAMLSSYGSPEAAIAAAANAVVACAALIWSSARGHSPAITRPVLADMLGSAGLEAKRQAASDGVAKLLYERTPEAAE